MSALPRLVLITPCIANVDSFGPALAEALDAGGVSSVVLRLGDGDERTLVNHVKALAPAIQARDIAVLVSMHHDSRAGGHDIAQIATRGGADGVHVEDGAELQRLRERYRDTHIIGAGNLPSRHAAMNAGEVGADYVMFGEPWLPGALDLDALIEHARWWAEIFEIPSVAIAPSLDRLALVAETGVEFIGLEDAVWSHPRGPRAAVAEARTVLESVAETLS